MVKGDAKRDYYADLEVSKDADIAEIKKQFRKLALKYHPDRNPGHEDEFNAKFQAIQSAHEVLSDPVQKAKYDAERARASYTHGPVPARPNVPPRNPYATYSDYPPPPRRPPARPSPTTSGPSYAAAGATGASRYSGFARTFYAGRPKEEPNARTNAYRAWESMNRAASGARPSTNPAPFPPPPRPTKSTTDPNQSPRQSRRTGFAPATPGGDEPPAAHRYSYAHVEREDRREEAHARSSRDRVPPLPRRHQASSQPNLFGRPTAPSEDGAGLDSPRLSTPYATRGGERTDLSGSTLRRSATVREDAKTSPPERHRSASPIRNRDAQDKEPLKTGTWTRPSTPMGSPPKRTYSDARPPLRHQRRHRTNLHESSFAHYVPSDTSSDSTRDSESESPSFLERLAAEKRDQGRRKNRHRHYQYPTYEPLFAQKQGTSTKTPNGQAGAGPPRASAAGRPDRASPSRPGVSNGVPNGHAAAASSGKKEGGEVPRYTFAVDDEMFIPTPPAAAAATDGRSANINTQFSPADQSIQFTSNVADYFQHRPVGKETTPGSRQSETVSADPATRSQSVPRRKPVSGEPTPGINGVPIMTASHSSGVADISPEEPFKGDFWAEQFKQNPLGPFPPTPSSPSRPGSFSRQQSASRQKPARPATASSPTKRTVGPQPASVHTPTDSSDEGTSAAASSANAARTTEPSSADANGDDSPMDIDTATPPSNKPADSEVPGAVPLAADGIRAASHASAENMQRDRASDDVSKAARTTIGVPPTSPHPPRPGIKTNGVPSLSELDLGSLKNVEPLAPGAQGLADMNDLQSTLPFTSQAARVPPISGDYEPQILELPSPPRAPPGPSSVTQSSWEIYVASMRAYMYEWSQFQDRMLAHFNERQRDAKEGLTPNWLGSLVEGPRGGYQRYMQGVEEDFRVRAHWDVAWEKHRDSMRAFGQVRNMALDRGLQAA